LCVINAVSSYQVFINKCITLLLALLIPYRYFDFIYIYTVIHNLCTQYLFCFVFVFIYVGIFNCFGLSLVLVIKHFNCHTNFKPTYITWQHAVVKLTLISKLYKYFLPYKNQLTKSFWFIVNILYNYYLLLNITFIDVMKQFPEYYEYY